MTTERRVLPLTGVEVRAGGDGGAPLIQGYAAVFNSPSLDLGGFREQIAPGAFKRSLRSGNKLSFFNHDPSMVLGSTRAKTLTVAENLEGLAYQVEPPDTQWARDLLVSMQRGDIGDASFTFRAVKDRWEVLEDGTQLRTLLEVELVELGPVTMGAYPAADSQVRTMLEARGLRLDDTNTALPSDPGPASAGPDAARSDTTVGSGDPEPAAHSLGMLRRRLELTAKSA